jgi:hypothetical protein
MGNNEGIGRRACKDGDEQDYLTKSHKHLVTNHGVRGKVKTARNKRVRRTTKQSLRNGREG